jgi:DNA-binding transcriptional MerR regulator
VVRIGEAAERLGVSPRTIKYYEELGLLAPARGGGNYRDYDEEDLERVERIRKLQKLGFSLAAIREFLKYPRRLDESGRRRLSTDDLETALHALEEQLDAARRHVDAARAELEQGEVLVASLEADVARCRERLVRRRAVPAGSLTGDR